MNLQTLKEIAENARRCEWPDQFEGSALMGDENEGVFIATFSPDLVLKLIAVVEDAMQGEANGLPETEQTFAALRDLEQE